MKNGIRLLIVLSLSFSAAGCTSLINVARPLATSRAAIVGRQIETEFQSADAEAIQEILGSQSNRGPEVVAPRAPILMASALMLDERGVENNGRRQRDLNFAKAQKQALANIEQQRRAGETMEREILPVCPEVTSTGSNAEAAVGLMSTCSFKLEPSIATDYPAENHTLEPIFNEPLSSRVPLRFVTIVALVLGSVTLPLARLSRDASADTDNCDVQEAKDGHQSTCELQKSLMINTEAGLMQFDQLCISTWTELNLYSNCAMIDPEFADWFSAVDKVELQESHQPSRALVLYGRQDQATLGHRHKNGISRRSLIVYHQAAIEAEGSLAALPHNSRADEISRSGTSLIRYQADHSEDVCSISNRSAVGQLIVSQSRQLVDVSGIQGLLVLFTEDQEVASVRRVKIVNSSYSKEAAEISVKVVLVA